MIKEILVAVLAGVLATPVQAEDVVFNKDEKSAIRALVKETLMEDPQIIINAVEKLKQDATRSRSKDSAEAVKAHREELVNSRFSPVYGEPDADVAIVQFFDYSCGFCKVMLDRWMQIVDNDDDVKMVFKEFPVMGKTSETAAKVALAAHMQDKYVPFHSALMKNRGRFSMDTILKEAKKLGLDMEQLKRDMNSTKVKRELKKNRELAEALGIRGTPFFVIGDTVLNGAVSAEDLKEAVEDAR